MWRKWLFSFWRIVHQGCFLAGWRSLVLDLAASYRESPEKSEPLCRTSISFYKKKNLLHFLNYKHLLHFLKNCFSSKPVLQAEPERVTACFMTSKYFSYDVTKYPSPCPWASWWRISKSCFPAARGDAPSGTIFSGCSPAGGVSPPWAAGRDGRTRSSRWVPASSSACASWLLIFFNR